MRALFTSEDMHSALQEDQKSIKIEFIEDNRENRSDPEPLRIKHEDAEEQRGWCLLFIPY